MAETNLGWRKLFINPVYKAIALIIAISSWFYVQQEQPAVGKVRAEIRWRLPPGFETIEPRPTAVTVQVEGIRSAVRRAEAGEVFVTADLQDVSSGAHTVELGSLDLQGLPPNITVNGISPSVIRVNLDREIVQQVRVIPNIVGDPQQGYAVMSAQVDPLVSRLKGARSTIASLRNVNTRPIDVSGMSADVVLPVELELPWGVSSESVRVSVDIEPLVSVRTFENVPVAVVGSSGFASLVKTVRVTVQGPAEDLQAIDANDVAALVHLPTPTIANRYEATFGSRKGAWFSFVYPGSQRARVTAVSPNTIGVVRL